MVATADEQVAEMIRNKGWRVLTKGWPDLLVYNPVIHDGYGSAVRGGQVLAIEIKRGDDKLRAEQEEMKNVFTYNLDVPFYVAKDEDIRAMTRKRGRIVVPWASLKDVMARVESLSNTHAALTRRIQEVNEELDSITQIFEEIPEPEKKAKVTRTQTDVKNGNRYYEYHRFARGYETEEVAESASRIVEQAVRLGKERQEQIREKERQEQIREAVEKFETALNPQNHTVTHGLFYDK